MASARTSQAPDATAGRTGAERPALRAARTSRTAGRAASRSRLAVRRRSSPPPPAAAADAAAAAATAAATRPERAPSGAGAASPPGASSGATASPGSAAVLEARSALAQGAPPGGGVSKPLPAWMTAPRRGLAAWPASAADRLGERAAGAAAPVDAASAAATARATPLPCCRHLGQFWRQTSQLRRHMPVATRKARQARPARQRAVHHMPINPRALVIVPVHACCLQWPATLGRSAGQCTQAQDSGHPPASSNIAGHTPPVPSQSPSWRARCCALPGKVSGPAPHLS